MNKDRIIPWVLAAFFAAISIYAFSIMNSNPSGPASGYGDSGVTNNVKNNVNGDKADLHNSIENDLNGSSNNQIENNITNNINVNVDVNVTNNLDNHVDDQNSGKGNGDQAEKEQGNTNEDGTASDGEVVWVSIQLVSVRQNCLHASGRTSGTHKYGAVI